MQDPQTTQLDAVAAIRETRAKLEYDIRVLLVEFHKKTSLFPVAIEVERVEFFGIDKEKPMVLMGDLKIRCEL